MSTSLDELERTFGVLFIGFILCAVLYGFTFFQSYVYFTRYGKDPIAIKLTAGLLCAIDTTTSALISQAVYYYLIDEFMSPVGLLIATPTFCAENGLAILATFIVQIFYATRAYQVSRHSWPVLVIISVIATIAFAFGITMTVQIFQQRRLAALATPRMEAVAGISQGLAALADILIVASLTWYLRPKGNPHMRRPDNWFDKIATVFINRGLCVTIVQLAYMCVFVAMPSKQIWIPFHLVISKLYINTLLAMLNSREIIQGRGINEEESCISARKSDAFTSSSDGTRNGPVRFNADSKLQSVNMELSQSSDIDIDGDSRKSVFIDYDGNSSRDVINENRKERELVEVVVG